MNSKLKGSAISTMTLIAFVMLISSEYFILQLEYLCTVSAWVTKSDIIAGQKITPDLLTRTRIDPNQIYGSIQNPGTLIGQTLVVHKQAGSTIYMNEVIQIDAPGQ